MDPILFKQIVLLSDEQWLAEIANLLQGQGLAQYVQEITYDDRWHGMMKVLHHKKVDQLGLSELDYTSGYQALSKAEFAFDNLRRNPALEYKLLERILRQVICLKTVKILNHRAGGAPEAALPAYYTRLCRLANVSVPDNYLRTNVHEISQSRSLTKPILTIIEQLPRQIETLDIRSELVAPMFLERSVNKHNAVFMLQTPRPKHLALVRLRHLRLRLSS